MEKKAYLTSDGGPHSHAKLSCDPCETERELDFASKVSSGFTLCTSEKTLHFKPIGYVIFG